MKQYLLLSPATLWRPSIKNSIWLVAGSCFPCPPFRPNGSVLLLAAPAKPKAIATALSDQSVLPDAARPRGASSLSVVFCSLLIL
jgi:hypothetical protein